MMNNLTCETMPKSKSGEEKQLKINWISGPAVH